jgi:hypothetical protein
MLKKMECGSACNGHIAEGCEHCCNGSKMVLLVTGECGWGCFYCPVSLEKKGLDVMFANEARVSTDEEIISEANSMDATGTGITGGDPLLVIDRTVHLIKLLKSEFGKEHHIHLYTATMDAEKVKMLEEAGLDEIRFHPQMDMWTHMDTSNLKGIVESTNMVVGIEVPAIPGKDKELNELVRYANSVGVKFINLNELEFSESNWNMMSEHDFQVKDDVSSAVLGSEETAMSVMKANRKINIHYCSSAFKDGVQLRRRLTRRAQHICTDYQAVTDDGTLVRGFVYGDDLDAIVSELKKLDVPDELFSVLDNKVEVAPWVLDDIAEELSFKCYISEQFPTADGLEVERTPLNRMEN